jgi:hypothetical protein
VISTAFWVATSWNSAASLVWRLTVSPAGQLHRAAAPRGLPAISRLEGLSDTSARSGVQRERSLACPARITAGAGSAHGLGHLQRIGVLLKNAVDLGRATLPIDGERIESLPAELQPPINRNKKGPRKARIMAGGSMPCPAHSCAASAATVALPNWNVISVAQPGSCSSLWPPGRRPVFGHRPCPRTQDALPGGLLP